MKMLYILNLAKRLNHFSHSSMLAALSLGMGFHIASKFSYPSPKEVQKDEEKWHVSIHQVDFCRNPLHPGNLKAWRQLNELEKKERFGIIHCNTPVGGLLGRLLGRKYRIHPMIYTAHGFHFYQGAPLINWLLFFPIEWLCARWTDVLITLNKEDYAFAKKHMPAKRVEYTPGVGIDTRKFSMLSAEKKSEIRRSLGVQDDEFMFLSVGEISPNKNQTNAIKALAKVNNPRVKYFIAGQGDLQTEVEKLIEEHHLFGQVELLGYRTDIPDLCGAADAYLFPSFREGLSVALMEAMACGLPVVASRIRGNTDLIDEGKGGYLVDPRDAEGMAQAIKTLVANPEAAAMGQYNMEKVKDFDMEKVTQALRRIYQSVMPESENSAES